MERMKRGGGVRWREGTSDKEGREDQLIIGCEQTNEVNSSQLGRKKKRAQATCRRRRELLNISGHKPLSAVSYVSR